MHQSGVYPRGCGATVVTESGKVTHHGLSPRVRGNHAYVLNDGDNRRSIPAGAGQPLMM